jgi:predicted transcriptional regulator
MEEGAREGDPPMTEARRPAGSLEQEVLAALAAAGRPLTPAEVREDLGRDLAYTTVLTALTRLYEKGALTRGRQGRAYAYTVAADSATLTARRMRQLLASDTDRATVLSRFVAELTPAEEQLLEQLLRDHRPPRRGKR